MSDRPILIIDSMNLYVRAYSACPDMSAHGYQVGGMLGFLRTLRKLLNEIQPIEVCLVWEGGGSSRRRALYSEYKELRKPEKLNRFYDDDIPDTNNNRQHQLVTLINLLKSLPVKQLYVSDCEGDDVVGYLARYAFKGKNKVIASSDKDMYQLLDPDTKIYSFYSKRFVTTEDVLEEYRITPTNFAIAKALCGDVSDNVPGVKGMGFKTIVKRFPFLGTENDITLQDLKDYCHSHVKESIHYKRVLESWDDVVRNWRLVYLDTNSLSHDQIKKIDYQLGTLPPQGNRMQLIKGLMKEGIGNFDVESLFYSLNCTSGITQ